MKRRKWWFIALSLALLAAAVGVWAWSERPPYQFMSRARLWQVSISDNPGWHGEVQIEYTVSEPLEFLVLGEPTPSLLSPPLA